MSNLMVLLSAVLSQSLAWCFDTCFDPATANRTHILTLADDRWIFSHETLSQSRNGRRTRKQNFPPTFSRRICVRVPNTSTLHRDSIMYSRAVSNNQRLIQIHREGRKCQPVVEASVKGLQSLLD